MVVLIKVGALGMDLPQVRAFVAKLREVASTRPVVLFPGGGAFADVVRDLDAQYNLGPDAAHWLAIHAMDSMGLLLSATCPGVAAFADIDLLRQALKFPTIASEDDLPVVPLWLPYAWIKLTDPAPHSWDVTADSLAVLCGAALGVEWVGLAKVTDQLAPHLPFKRYPSVSTRQLRDLMMRGTPETDRASWAVDPYLPDAVDASNLPCKIFDARALDEVAQLILGAGHPIHVEVRPS
ncbi:MAG TPA: hypothetical protein VKK79_18070 [Candidatus Lokiarchaeia archaeon]|nr:hypothetical protein [Candidatus Lokiarchaeia archaeon]